jgi:hypothetical protein
MLGLLGHLLGSGHVSSDGRWVSAVVALAATLPSDREVRSKAADHNGGSGSSHSRNTHFIERRREPAAAHRDESEAEVTTKIVGPRATAGPGHAIIAAAVRGVSMGAACGLLHDA